MRFDGVDILLTVTHRANISAAINNITFGKGVKTFVNKSRDGSQAATKLDKLSELKS
ncbi:MAG: hypothetical protein HC836_04715 [Richelia sp. RM2_1_2]|nr:hypothetical protein [Richelia sp. SM2_1_7]NJM17492.1 hypothetical protein [Richelia sp. SM1_7_0]NJN11713.1 hypothetical protein [Richelia sp. RM1_1_1]NJO26665.1 hypothetical protein [Richelia sp. SL_2_1]NJO57686.1 hypothetical protein [Richelia sp. RM2_1_2]NJS16296.1 hypothetical protein [Nostocaceae cyanobacterium CSU_2_110]